MATSASVQIHNAQTKVTQALVNGKTAGLWWYLGMSQGSECLVLAPL